MNTSAGCPKETETSELIEKEQKTLSKKIKQLQEYYSPYQICKLFFYYLLIFLICIALPIAELVFLVLYFDDYGPCPSEYQWILLCKLLWAILLNASICTMHFAEQHCTSYYHRQCLVFQSLSLE
eukprot:553271_1